MKAVKQISIRKKYGLILGSTWGVWLALTAAIYFLVLGPQNTLMARLKKDFAASNEEVGLAQKAGRSETKVGLQQRLEDVSQKTAYFIVPQENASALLLQISQLAAKHQLKDFTSRIITGSSASRKKEMSKIAEAWIELEFSGSFPQIASFINSLERNDPVVFVENINIRRSSRIDEPPSATVQISYFCGKPDDKKTESASKPNSKIKK